MVDYNSRMNGNIKQSFYWSFLENVGSLGIQFVSLIVLSRFLSPEEYGIMGIIAIFIAVSNMFVDSGMGASLVKKEYVSILDYSTLFWYNICISLFLYFLISLFTNSIADFYNLNQLSVYIQIIGLTIIVNSIGIVQNIQLIRELKFKSLAIISISANILSSFVAILLAVNNYGIWALIMQQVTLSIIKMFGLLITNRFLPSFKFSIKSFKEQFSFGFHLLLSSLLKTIYDNIYSSVLGKFVTPVSTGYYVQANKLQNIPVNLTTTIVDRAMFPVLSRIDDSDNFKKIATSLFKKILLIIIPILLLLSVSSSYVLNLLLGNQWSGAAWILSVLCIAGIGVCIQALNRNILKSLGVTKKIFQIEVLKIISGILVLSISLWGGIYYIIWGILLSSILACFISGYILSIEMNYSMKEQFRDIFQCLSPYLISFIGLYIFNHFFLFSSFVGIIINIFLFVILFVLTIFLFDLSEIKEFFFRILKYSYYGIRKKICND